MALWNQPVHQFNSTTIKEALNLYLVPVAVEQCYVLALKCMLNDASLPRCETQIAGYRRLLEMALMEIDKVKHDYFLRIIYLRTMKLKFFQEIQGYNYVIWVLFYSNGSFYYYAHFLSKPEKNGPKFLGNSPA